MDSDELKKAKTIALKSCVARMKAKDLKGKARDDASGHFLAGANAVLGSFGLTDEFAAPMAENYTDVLEALAD